MKLSIIVVTWNNENFIEQALTSCIDPNFHDYEVIVVHNASTDRTGELIRRAIIGNESRFHIIENSRNEGLGEARNIGMRHASGDYIMFLDGDDWYEPNAIASITNLVTKHDPDVLVFNYQRAWDTGGKEQNTLTYLLEERDVSKPKDRKIILTNFSSSSNKVYRRNFIKKIGVSFPDGFYEDIVWSFKTLFSADSCYVTPLIIFNYRQRTGSITRSVDDRHLDIIKQYKTLINYLSLNPLYNEQYGATSYKYGRSQIFNVINRGIRLPKNKQKEFLKLSSNLLDGWRRDLNIKTIDPTLIFARTGSPILYKMGRKLAISRKKFKNQINRHKRNLKNLIKRIIYNGLYCRLPLNIKRVYFEAYWGSKADCNPLAISEKLKKNGGYELIWGFDKKAIIPDNFPYKVVRKGTAAYYKVIATSGYLISNTNLNNDVVKRIGAIHVQTHHGTPIKSMGIDIRPFNPKELNWNQYAKRCRRWDFVISSNAHSSKIWRQAMPYDYKIIETGYPRNDIFWHTTELDIINLKNSLNIPLDKKVALYAPTWRQRSDNGINLEPAELKSALGEEYVLLLRSHYFNDNKFENYPEGIINVTEHNISNEICLISDILISDYSSIIFDYACLKRPIIIFTDDYDDYAKKRGVYFDIRQKAPGPVANSIDELKVILKNRLFKTTDSMNKLAQFNQEFCQWEDGYAADRVIENIFKEP